MGGACDKCGGYDQMKEDIDTLKKTMKMLEGQQDKLDKATSMLTTQMKTLEKSKEQVDQLVSSSLTQLDKANSAVKKVKEGVFKTEELAKKIPGVDPADLE